MKTLTEIFSQHDNSPPPRVIVYIKRRKIALNSSMINQSFLKSFKTWVKTEKMNGISTAGLLKRYLTFHHHKEICWVDDQISQTLPSEIDYITRNLQDD